MKSRTSFGVLLVLSTLPVMTGSVLSPALPSLRAAFGGGAGAQAWARWALTTPALFAAFGAPLAGAVIDWKGRRPVLLASLLLFGVSGSAGGLLGSLPAITASRAVLGLAAGGIGTTATTLLVDYTDEAQSRALGGQAAVMAVAAMAYTVLGGALADASWRAPFGLYLLGWALFVPALHVLPEPNPSASSPDPDSPEPSGDPGIPWTRIAILYGLAALGLATFNLVRVELPYYLRSMSDLSGVWIGGVLSAGTLTGALASAVYDRLASRIGVWGTLAGAMGLFAAGFAVIAGAGRSLVVLGGLLLAGGGMGLLVPSLSDGIGTVAPPAQRGRLLGGLSTVRNLGRFAAPLLVTPTVVGEGAAAPFLVGATLAGGVAAALLLGQGLRVLQDALPSSSGPIRPTERPTGRTRREAPLRPAVHTAVRCEGTSPQERRAAGCRLQESAGRDILDSVGPSHPVSAPAIREIES